VSARLPIRQGNEKIRPTLEQLETRLAPAVLTVTNNLDWGAGAGIVGGAPVAGSLRATIAAANQNNDSANLIVFAPALLGQLIMITNTTPITITKPVAAYHDYQHHADYYHQACHHPRQSWNYY
jgi:hypothetical protein